MVAASAPANAPGPLLDTPESLLAAVESLGAMLLLPSLRHAILSTATTTSTASPATVAFSVTQHTACISACKTLLEVFTAEFICDPTADAPGAPGPGMAPVWRMLRRQLAVRCSAVLCAALLRAWPMHTDSDTRLALRQCVYNLSTALVNCPEPNATLFNRAREHFKGKKHQGIWDGRILLSLVY